jgi:hypothetical protein
MHAVTQLVASELRRTEGGGLLAASADAIVLRVPAAVGVVCASGAAATVIAVLPAGDAAPVPSGGTTPTISDATAPVRSGATALGWQKAQGAFVVRDGRVTTRAVPASACAGAAIEAPEGSTYLAISPAASDAGVGTAAVLFDYVEYAFRASSRVAGARALWRTAGGETRELLAPIVDDAGFRFYVDAAPGATAVVPSPLARVRGVALNLASSIEAPDGVLAATETAVFFRQDAT